MKILIKDLQQFVLLLLFIKGFLNSIPTFCEMVDRPNTLD